MCHHPFECIFGLVSPIVSDGGSCVSMKVDKVVSGRCAVCRVVVLGGVFSLCHVAGDLLRGFLVEPKFGERVGFVSLLFGWIVTVILSGLLS